MYFSLVVRSLYRKARLVYVRPAYSIHKKLLELIMCCIIKFAFQWLCYGTVHLNQLDKVDIHQQVNINHTDFICMGRDFTLGCVKCIKCWLPFVESFACVVVVCIGKFSICLHWLLKARLLIGL